MTLSRRDLMKVSAGGIAALAGCYYKTDSGTIAVPGADEDTMRDAHSQDTIAEQIHVAPDVHELPSDPPLLPALGITNEGRYMWSDEYGAWVGPIGIGSEEHPADPSHFESVDTDSLPDVYDHVIGTDDDLVDIINNQVVAGESAVVGPGTHVIPETLRPPNNFRFSILGEVKLDTESNTRMISRGDSVTGPPQNLVIDGHGVGVMNGNKANQTYTGTRHDHPGMWLRGDDTGIAKDISIRNLEIKGIVAGAGISLGGTDFNVGYKPAKRCILENLYIHNCGVPADNAESDGIWHGVEDHVTRGCVVHDVSDTPYAFDGPRTALLTDSIAFETGDQQMARCVTAFPNVSSGEMFIVGNYFYNGTGPCITTYNSTSQTADILIANNYIGTGFSFGVQDKNGNAGDLTVSNNRIALDTSKSTTGIIVDGADFASVRGNIVETGQNQISFRNMDNVVCIGNITRAGSGGIVWYENDGATHENAIISGNYCEGHSNRDVFANANMQNYVIVNNILKSATAIDDNGTSKVVRDNIGYQALITGTATVSGDGAATTFNIGLHGLAENPSTRSDVYAEATPASADAVAGAPVSCYPVDANADGAFEDLEIKFAAAPPSGTDNVTVRWTARLATKTGS